MAQTEERSENGAVLVVGAGPRLGAAIARRLAMGGRYLGLIGRSATDVAETLSGEGFSAFGVNAEVGDADDLTRAIGELADKAGAFDISVHNVSAWREAGATTLTQRDLLADLATGTASLATITNAVTPGMIERGHGTVLATGSAAADSPTPGAPSLSVQKAALRALVRGFAAELAPKGVHCATVTINGLLDQEGFGADDIAEVYGSLVAETAGPRDAWRTVVEFNGRK